MSAAHSTRTRTVADGRTWTMKAMATALLLASAPAFAYPEFQVYVNENSGRNVNCSLCHAHPDGPEGLKPGQIGRLTSEQLQELGKARAAFEPGQQVHSPILNEFGNHIIEKLGKQRFLQLRQEPATLAEALGPEGDLDQDGLSDAREYLEGTHPLDPNHGDPWSLFFINFGRRWFDVLMITLATVAGVYGLTHLLRGFEQLAGPDKPPHH